MNEGKEGPRRRLSAEARRGLILEAAIREFGERGYEKASIRAIATGAGVSTPVIYDHFSSKRELYIAIIEEEEAGLREYQQRERAAEDVYELAHSVVDDFFRWVEDHPRAWSIVFRDVPSDPEIAAAQRQAQQRSLGQIQGFIARNSSQSTAAPLSPEIIDQLLSKGAYAVNNELAAWWLDNPQVPRQRIVETAVGFLMGAAESLKSTPNRSG